MIYLICQSEPVLAKIAKYQRIERERERRRLRQYDWRERKLREKELLSFRHERGWIAKVNNLLLWPRL
jgi:hypothetical protein